MITSKDNIPKNEGYYMPAEFDEHAGTWMLWPERPDIWRLGAKPAQQIFLKIANEISHYEKITVGVNQTQYENARNKLNSNIRVVEISYDDAWIRDTGPTFIAARNKPLCGIDWFFNAWGGIGNLNSENQWDLIGSYYPWKLDDMVARKILEIENAKRFRCPLILEGGAIHTDGKGTLLAIKECVLGRNPNLRINEIENLLKMYLGVNNFVWLDRGLYLEENNGHIDNMCCFADDETILLNWCDVKDDPQYEISKAAYEILISAENTVGHRYKIVKVKQPPVLKMAQEEGEGIDSSEYAIPRLPDDRLPASYVNSYILNGAVIIPSFTSIYDSGPEEYDYEAFSIFTELFPNREIIQIPARELLLGGGGIHCILQQVPKIQG